MIVKYCGVVDDLFFWMYLGWFGFVGYCVYVDCSGFVDGEVVGGNYLFWMYYEVLLFFEFVGWDDYF